MPVAERERTLKKNKRKSSITVFQKQSNFLYYFNKWHINSHFHGPT